MPHCQGKRVYTESGFLNGEGESINRLPFFPGEQCMLVSTSAARIRCCSISLPVASACMENARKLNAAFKNKRKALLIRSIKWNESFSLKVRPEQVLALPLQEVRRLQFAVSSAGMQNVFVRSSGESPFFLRKTIPPCGHRKCWISFRVRRARS